MKSISCFHDNVWIISGVWNLLTSFSKYAVVFFLDNVHFQQAAEISEALVNEQVDFEAMVSTRENLYDDFR